MTPESGSTNMLGSLSKGCFFGTAGCLGGCLVFVIGIFLMFGALISACVGIAMPLGFHEARQEGVEIVMNSSAPRNVVRTLLHEVQENGANREYHGRSTATWQTGNHAWIRIGGRSFDRGRDEVRAALEAAIRRLESRGELPRDSVRVVGTSRMGSEPESEQIETRPRNR